MEETKNDQLTQKLAAMEKLLQEQLAQNKKIAKHRAIMSVLMLCMVVVFAAGLFGLNRTVSNATRELPQLIESTNQSVQQLKVTLEDVSSIDYATLNDAIIGLDEGVAAVDFEALNSAITDLQKATEGLAKLASIF